MGSIYRHFTLPLLHWFEQYGRKDLPWQHPRNAYRVWISEIMLQQTQVKTVIPYFTRFLESFPDVHTLAIASEDNVLAHWSGLGYYSRARNLHKTATIIATDFQGIFPSELDKLIKLPGIGPSTAAAIASLAFDKPTAILDGNVKRVLSRYFLIDGLTKQASIQQTLWKLANDCMPKESCANYTQAIMDLGATCCTTKKPNCEACPLQETCLAKKHDVVTHYPNKTPKKLLPHKQQQFLLLHNDDNLIYLEKRPPIGLWGGLWCLPSIEMEHCPIRYVETTYQFKTNNLKEFMIINHSFSHFHLQIKALTMQTMVSPHSVADHPGNWFAFHEISALGIAKPVSDIINNFYNQLQ